MINKTLDHKSSPKKSNLGYAIKDRASISAKKIINLKQVLNEKENSARVGPIQTKTLQYLNSSLSSNTRKNH